MGAKKVMITRKRTLLLLAFPLMAVLVFVATTLTMKAFGARHNASTRIAVGGITVFVCFFLYLWLRQKLGENPTQTFWPRYGGAIAVWTVIGLVLSLIPYFLTVGWQQFYWGNLRIELIAAATVMALTAAFLEEVFFRDMVFRWTLERYSVTLCVVIQVIAFSAMHFVSSRFNWHAVLTYSVGAILASMLWLITEDFLAPMAAHFVYNFSLHIFHGVNTQEVVRAGLLLGDIPVSLIYVHQALEILAILVIWWVWRYKLVAKRNHGVVVV